MSRGTKTRFGREAIPEKALRPNRTGSGAYMEDDYWYCCDRCAQPWPRLKLSREQFTGNLVCTNCNDQPTVDQRASQVVLRRWFEQLYRFGVDIF